MYEELPKLKAQLENANESAEDKDNKLLRTKVTEEEIAMIVGRWTGIPVSKLMESERKNFLTLIKFSTRELLVRTRQFRLLLMPLFVQELVYRTLTDQ